MSRQAYIFPQRDCRAAFTLVELLVVVGILILLMAILLPSVGRAREASRRTVCLSNLRQIHLGLTAYAMSNEDAVALGHRTASKQFNSMVFSTTAGNRWVLFGLLYTERAIPRREVLFCPAESNIKFAFDTPSNPWPADDALPPANIQAGYAMRPDREIPDDPANPPAQLQPFQMPRLSQFAGKAILADLTAARSRVLLRHVDGVNVCYADGSAGWVSLRSFDRPDAQWPEPALPPAATFNATQDAIWAAFDRR